MRFITCNIVILLLLCGLSAHPQGMSFYNDYLGNIWVFDGNNTKQIDHQPAKEYGVGNNSFVYVDNSGGLKIYHNNYLHNASSFVSDYVVTDNLISFTMNTQLKVFDDGNFHTLCASMAKYWADDDIVVWYDDMQHMLMCYWNGKKYTLDDVLSTGEPSFVEVGENIAVFIDVNGNLNAFYLGEIEQIIYGKNLVDASSYLKVFEDFETRTISFDEPEFYDVEDEIMVFGVQNYFKAYIKGKVYTLESFIPKKYFINNHCVAYLDQMGNLKYFDGNKTEIISYEKVTDFELTGDAVRYSFGVKSENIYYEGKTYKND